MFPSAPCSRCSGNMCFGGVRMVGLWGGEGFAAFLMFSNFSCWKFKRFTSSGQRGVLKTN